MKSPVKELLNFIGKDDPMWQPTASREGTLEIDRGLLYQVVNYLQHLEGELGLCESKQEHPDDAAVNKFAVAMKEKLAQKRAEGRGGWDDPAQCSTQFLADLLLEHVCKGDPLDVGNLAMMLWNRGAPATALPNALDAYR
jgi:hypothetical protein